MKLATRTDPELHTLARDICAGKVFTTWELPPHDWWSYQESFLPIHFMKRRDAKQLVDRAGLIYEYRDLAVSTTDGRPLFLSYQALTHADTDRVIAMLNELRT
jgi:hypothetical protein